MQKLANSSSNGVFMASKSVSACSSASLLFKINMATHRTLCSVGSWGHGQLHPEKGKLNSVFSVTKVFQIPLVLALQ